MYRQTLPGHDLSIEQGTANVPDDGSYYVLHRGERRGKFRSLSQATRCYLNIKASLEITPPPPVPPLSANEIWQRDLSTQSNKSLIWSEDDFTRIDKKTRGRPKH